jgi:hypothetical protein
VKIKLSMGDGSGAWRERYGVILRIFLEYGIWRGYE